MNESYKWFQENKYILLVCVISILIVSLYYDQSVHECVEKTREHQEKIKQICEECYSSNIALYSELNKDFIPKG